MVVLAALILVDLVVPATVGSICSHEADCARGFGLFHFIAHVWPKGPYYFGASSLDLMVASVIRAIAWLTLVACRACLRRRPGATPRRLPRLSQPLNAALLPEAAAAALHEPNEERPAARVSAPRAAWIAFGITAASWTHASAKAVARLLQSGSGHGDGFHVLPLVTTPPELEFWVCMCIAYIVSEGERYAFLALSVRACARGVATVCLCAQRAVAAAHGCTRHVCARGVWLAAGAEPDIRPVCLRVAMREASRARTVHARPP